MDFLLQLQATVALFSLLFFCNLCISKVFSKNTEEPPQPSGAWPVLGHLHLLQGPKPLAQILGTVADKHGPVLMLRFGMRPTLVVSSWEVAKECFTTNDKVLSSRPSNAAAKFLGYNYAMFGFAPYGAYWRSQRKIATSELLSNTRVEMLRHARSTEIDTCINELYGLWKGNDKKPVKVDMKKWFGDMNYNIAVSLVAGKRYFGSAGGSDEAWRFRKAAGEFFRLLGVFVMSDVFPLLGWLDLGGHVRAMKSAAKEMDLVMDSLVEEHRRRRLARTADDGDRDFLDVMLSIMEDAELSGSDPDTVIKATSLALILGGTDTTTISLTWTLALLLNHRDVLKKAQAELDSEVGKDRLVDESDVKSLAYLQAVVKEAFRLFPAAPLLVPREAIEDCRVGGFRVRAGTRVLVNAWKLQRDPGSWAEPDAFRPERFLPGGQSAGVDVRGQNFELIPFGSGRRSCPGASFTLQVMYLALARLVQGFELEPPGNEPVEMSERLGMCGPESIPLELLPTPRLPLKLYEP